MIVEEVGHVLPNSVCPVTLRCGQFDESFQVRADSENLLRIESQGTLPKNGSSVVNLIEDEQRCCLI